MPRGYRVTSVTTGARSRLGRGCPDFGREGATGVMRGHDAAEPQLLDVAGVEVVRPEDHVVGGVVADGQRLHRQLLCDSGLGDICELEDVMVTDRRFDGPD